MPVVSSSTGELGEPTPSPDSSALGLELDVDCRWVSEEDVTYTGPTVSVILDVVLIVDELSVFLYGRISHRLIYLPESP